MIGSILVWTLVELEKMPILKETVVTEVRNYSGDIDSHVLEDDSKFPFLDSIIDETIRLYGFLSYPSICRCTMFDINIENIIIPKDTILFIPVSSLNYSCSAFLHPLSYDPYRYAKREIANTTSIFSFGSGYHACPAQTFSRNVLKSILVSLLKNFHFQTTDGQLFPPVYPRSLGGDIFPIPQGNLEYIYFENRMT
jgi:cytochrome P450